MGNRKHKSIVTSHSTHGRDVGKELMNKDKKILLDRFLNDARYRETQEKLGWTEAAECKEMDELAPEDHTCKVRKVELDRYRSNWREGFKFSETYRQGPRIDPHIGSTIWSSSSSSSSWWQSDKWDWY